MHIELPKSTSNGFVTSSNVPTISKINTANGGGIDKHSSSFLLGEDFISTFTHGGCTHSNYIPLEQRSFSCIVNVV